MPEKKRVLVVDDEQGVLHFISISLGLLGYEVVTTLDGEEAVKLAQEQHFDVMLLDIFMVPLTGFEVLEKLRAVSQLPVIVFTARPDVASIAIREGANGFIGKPFRPEDLAAKIEEVLASIKPEK